MSDPQRLLKRGDDEFECSLLRSAANDNPPRARRARVVASASLAAAAAAKATTVAAAEAGGVAVVSKALGAVALLKWSGIALLALGVTAATVHTLGSPAGAPPSAASRQASTAPLVYPAPATNPLPSALEIASQPPIATASPAPPSGIADAPAAQVAAASVAPARSLHAHTDSPSKNAPLALAPPAPDLPSSPGPSAALPSAAAMAPPPPDSPAQTAPLAAPTQASSSLASEIAALDGARLALRAHRPASAVARLDAYAQRFPRGAMAPEASVLRIEALVALGRRPDAERLARAFLTANHASPLAARVRGLLDFAIDSRHSND